MSFQNSRSFRLGLMGSIAGSVIAVAGAAWAQAKTFDVPAQPAATGVADFARQADIQVLVSEAAARGKQTNAVRGAFETAKALEILLHGTGLRAEATSVGVYTLIPAATSVGYTADGPSSGAGPDAAPTTQATTVGEVVVTGTRIHRPNTTSAAPIVTITQQDLQLEGLVNIEDVLNQLPQVRGDATQYSNTSDNDGRTKVNLRDLGYQRTLILLDGQRFLPAQAVDLNFVPTPLVQRVDVLTGGASAVYGSDAIAGVINFVLNKKFDGVQVNESYGFFEHDNNDTSFQHIVAQYPSVVLPKGSTLDGIHQDTNIAIGHNFLNDTLNVSLFADYRYQDPVKFSARDYSSCRLTVINNSSEDCTVNTTYNSYGTFTPQTGPNAGSLFFGSMSGNGVFVPNSPAEQTAYAINTRGDWNFLRADERFNGGLFLNYHPTAHLEFYMNFMFLRDRSDSQFYYGLVGPQTFDINCNNPYLSASQATTLCGSAAGTSTLVPTSVALRLDGPGAKPLVNQTFDDEYRVATGMRGAFGGVWNYDVGAVYSRVNTGLSDRNEIDPDFGNTLNVVTVNGVATCASNVNGADPKCVPANIFGYHTVNPKVYPYIYDDYYWGTQTFEQDYSANLTGDLTSYGIKSPWAEKGLAVAIGAEYRRDEINEKANAAAIAYEGYLSNLAGATGVYEFYGELDAPVLTKLPFAELLDFSTAYRVSKYENQSKFLATYKDEIKYKPYKDLLFRASFNRATRAPNVNELDSPSTYGTVALTDPCAGASPTASLTVCERTGVTAAQYGHIQPCDSGGNAGSCTTFGGNGNPHLAPETATTKTFGVVYTPSFIKNLTVSVDYYDIEIKGFIGPVYANDVFNQCLNTGLAYYCRFIHRDATGGLSANPNGGSAPTSGYIADGAENTDTLLSKGFDFQANYDRSLGQYGRISSNLNGTLDREHGGRDTPLSPIVSCVGYFGPPNCYVPRPAWRHNLRTTWFLPANPFVPQGSLLSLNWRYIGGTRVAANSSDTLISQGAAPYTVLTKVPQYNYFDLSGEVPIHKGVKLRVVVNNLFDVTPPVVPSSYVDGTTNNPNTWTSMYDPLGRSVLMTLSLKY
jgi:outer membrane receptor protein involved in Fe transport